MRQHILLVDDETEALEELGELLEGEGFHCHSASSVETAMQCLAAWPAIELVITDLRMPDESGLRLIHNLRSTPQHATLPIIVMSGHADMNDVIGLLPLQVVDFLPKPIYQERLIEVLNQRFPVSQAVNS
ncbi:Response regulator receiver domain-containing protein [Pseudomonas flavescens]|uniref:Response regulator receiver domain-containing protein n=1 Tax=Phytopseudomonas flavescens TaxID=29435 RepID=A0A1G8ASK9_9GAMM|nr:response regulator [Pseudomonas flavescens]SDH23955.1 Response regulator receiver domain-containing protein [Pseudomonas flavescens]